MKKTLHLIAFLLIAFSSAYGQQLCDTSYWNHTYLNQRLKVYDSCVIFDGKIELLDPPFFTGDGDYHIYVAPDTAYQWMVKYRTIAFQKTCWGLDSTFACPTCLNVEEVCKGAPTDTGFYGNVERAACNGFSDTVYLPNLGEHVRFRGPFIFDSVHCWNEIHPVSSCAIIKPAGINEIDGAALVSNMKIFPQPAKDELNFRFEHAPNAIVLVKLYNIAGQQMFVYALSETNSLKLDVTTWPNGEYLYSIVLKDQSKQIKSGRFSVVH